MLEGCAEGRLSISSTSISWVSKYAWKSRVRCEFKITRYSYKPRLCEVAECRIDAAIKATVFPTLGIT